MHTDVMSYRIAVLVSAIGITSAVYAPSQAGAQEAIGITVTPRVQYLVTQTDSATHSTNYQASSDDIHMPFYGLTIGYAPPISEWDISLTGLYGNGSDDYYAINRFGNSTVGTVDMTRIDIEANARYWFTEDRTGFFFGGLRYVHLDSDTNVTSNWQFFETGTNSYEESQNIYLTEIGIGGAANLSEERSQQFIGTIGVGIGYYDSTVENATTTDYDESGFALAWDMSAGYSINILEDIAAGIRYRATFLPAPYQDGTVNFLVSHGPEISVTRRF